MQRPFVSSRILIWSFVTALGFPGLVRAQMTRWVLPSGQAGQLQISNPETQELDLYRKNWPTLSAPEEENYRLPARSTTSLDLSEVSQPSVLDAPHSRLRVLWSPGPGLPHQLLTAGQSPFLRLTEKQTSAPGDLWLTNLSSQSQDGEILAWKPGQTEVEHISFQLKGHEVRRLSEVGFLGSALEIRGQYNLGAFWKTTQGNLHFPSQLRNDQPLPPPRGRYFVLADDRRAASFLVDLVDPRLQDQARHQIAHPELLLPRILIAEIETNQNQSNRNWIDPKQAPWSWKVGRVHRFASVASQFCDGHPQMIEDQLPDWLQGAHAEGRPLICLWGYQIILELP